MSEGRETEFWRERQRPKVALPDLYWFWFVGLNGFGGMRMSEGRDRCSLGREQLRQIGSDETILPGEVS